MARLKAPNLYNVQYMLRVENPNDDTIDYMLTLDGFKELGTLCLDLSKFCEDSISPNEKQVKTLQKLLTAENIRNYVKISKMKTKK